MAAVKRLRVILHSADYIFVSFGIIDPILVTLKIEYRLNLLLLNTTYPVLANSIDPEDSEEANWSGYALFVIKYVNFYQKLGSSNLIGWKLEVGMAS